MSLTRMRRRIANIDCVVSEPGSTVDDIQTLVCLHGIGGDDKSFALQSDLSKGYRVVVWNMPGYRESDPLPTTTFESLSASLQQLVAALDCGPVHLIGQSIGGMIAQDFYHRFPDRVRSLILVATTTAFGGRDDSFKNAFLKARLKPLDDGKTMQEIAEQGMRDIVGPDTDSDIVQSAIDSMASVNEEAYRDVLRCLVTFDRRSEWADIRCPVCIVAGSEDSNAPAATMRKMADKLPQSKYHELKNAGHLVNLERGTEFNAIAKQFLESIDNE